MPIYEPFTSFNSLIVTVLSLILTSIAFTLVIVSLPEAVLLGVIVTVKVKVSPGTTLAVLLETALTFKLGCWPMTSKLAILFSLLEL